MDTDFRMRRQKKRITLKQISENTGITIASLSNYETGKMNPGLTNAIKIDEYLKSMGV